MNNYEATEIAYKNGYEAGKPKWISVKERKPTIGDADEIGLVLVYTKNKENLITQFSDVWRFADFISHWMPLPEPPTIK